MFLDHLDRVCHGRESVVSEGNGILRCRECQNTTNAYEYITMRDFQNPFYSSYLALEYAKWTGDISVPCTFALVDIPGIVPKKIRVPLNVLINATRLLRFATAPFLPPSRNPIVAPLDEKILNNFLQDYIQSIEKMNFPDTLEARTVRALLGNMRRIFDGRANFFQHYFEVVVPYVKKFCDAAVLDDEDAYDGPAEPSRAFYYESRKSNRVREKYARYCIPFDIVHVMIYCYLCSWDSEAVANLCFDLAARVCRPETFVASPLVSGQIVKILSNSVAYNKNTELYYLIREMEKGNTSECLSVDFLEKYGKLEHLLLNEFLRRHDDAESDVLKFAFSQNFPHVLFAANRADEYYGFITSLGYLLSKLKTRSGILEKGTFGNAKRIYRFVNMFASRIRDFERNKNDARETVYWTMDAFKLLLCSDEILHGEFNEMIHLLMNEKRAEEAGDAGTTKIA